MDRLKKRLKKTEPLTWLFYGDSITHGVAHLFGAKNYTEHFTERVRSEMGRHMDTVINTAISGQITTQLLETFDQRVARFNPNVVFVMIGMNDCAEVRDITVDQFAQNLHTLAQNIEALGALPIFQTNCLILPGSAPDREPHLPVFMEAMRKVAQEQNLPLIDHTAFWQQQQEKHGIHYFWMSDAFHPNAAGHLAFAHKIFNDLDMYDTQSATCQLFSPANPDNR